MRHVLVLVAALAALVASAIAAAAAPTSTVTIAARPSVVVYGSQATLFGAVPRFRENDEVTVLSAPCATTALTLANAKPSGTAAITASGSWRTRVRPTVNTGYAAGFRGSKSVPLVVGVRPHITLMKVGPHRFDARIAAAQSFAGKRALFQRFRSAPRAWRTIRRVTLGPSAGTQPAPTIVSVASFRSSVRAGLRVRLVLRQSQVGSCYLAGRSAPIVS
jgi:hypothetical protein